MFNTKKKEKAKNTILIYTEQTPNQEVLKFVTNRKFCDGAADFSNQELALEWSPFASALYDLPYVKSVFINNNYVSIEKEFSYNWRDIMLIVKDFIKSYLAQDKPIVKDGYMEMIEEERAKRRAEGDDDEIVERIHQVIDQHIRPGIEMDGGNIEFISYEDGVLVVSLLGACRTCSAASVTLTAGVERIIKSMIPEVTEVVQDFGY
jgi:Fe-S cluster biogenesis protein NfuA